MVPKLAAAPDDPREVPNVDPAITRALERLRTRGHRITMPRRAVIEALAGRDGHPSADELCAEIEQRHPGIHRTTVYRTLETLAELSPMGSA